MKILVLNSGSSSIKYECFDMQVGVSLSDGLVERIGEQSSRIKHQVTRDGQKHEFVEDVVIHDHRQGLERVAKMLMDDQWGVICTPQEISAVGHRVVHGGERFSQPTVIDEEVRAEIRELISLAPLHNPANLTGIEVATEIFQQAVQVAVFDTAFHQTMPPSAYRYAIPDDLYQQHSIRSFGFHGTSHLYVSKAAIKHIGKSMDQTNLITAHLGNGASITAVRGGKSIDTSMGFGPLTGLMMGSRSGDIDPTIILFLGSKLGMSFEEIDKMLNKESGLIGISGDNDLRDIERRQTEGDPKAQLALDMYTYRIKKYIGAYLAALGSVDALVFTAGVGEKSPYVRWHACLGLESLGIMLDREKNNQATSSTITEIQHADSNVKVLVIPTNEELEIAQQTAMLLTNE